MKKLNIPKVLFWFSCFAIVFGYGVSVGMFELFPYSLIKAGRDSVRSVINERGTIMGTRPQEYLRKTSHAGKGVTHFDQERSVPGLTFLSGFFSGGNELQLIRSDGSEVRRWPVQFSKLFPDTTYIQPKRWVPRTDWNVELHGALALPDGSVVFNFEKLGMVKLDRCGAVQWTLPALTHHSIEQSEAGGFWVGGHRYWATETKSPFPLLKTPFIEDLIWKVSPEGKIVGEISILRLLFENNLQGAILFSNGVEGISLASNEHKAPGEVTHLNDVEELNRRMAAQFPQFAPGDLLLSERDYNLLMVIDPQTLKIKWRQRGPWIAQHDPDFEPNGTISVFNNNDDLTSDGSLLGGTTILEVKPVLSETSDAVVTYGAAPGQRMYSEIRGKHQRLEGGNILITETESGRVLEVDSKGNTVWEFINRYDDDEVAIVTQAVRYPEGYFNVRDWACR